MDATVAYLQDLVRKEGRSLLQYIGESFPWTTAQTHKHLPTLQEMVAEERDGAAAIARFLVKHRQRPPYLGAYPMSFTTINFIDLAYLLPFLVDFEKRRIAELDKDQAALQYAEARQLVQGLLDMKRRHLKTLVEMAA